MRLLLFFTTVTPFSKLLALLVFILFPFTGFYLGMQYQKSFDTVEVPSLDNPKDKYYVGTSGECLVLDYYCPDGYMRFGDSQGCGCKRSLDSPLVSSVDQSDWKTYRNEKYGFEFQYPSDMNVEGSSDSYTLSRPFISDPITYDNNFWMKVYLESKDSQESLEEFFVKRFCESIEQSAYTPDLQRAINSCREKLIQTKRDLQIDDRNTIQARNIYYVTERQITLIDNDSEIIVFSLGETGEEGSGISDKALNLLDQILSTFRFLDSKSTEGLIEDDYRAGRINYEQKILYLTYAVYEYSSLPDKYNSSTPWRGTIAVEEIYQAVSNPNVFCKFKESIQNELKRLKKGNDTCTQK